MSTSTSTTTTVTDPSAISGYNRGPLTTVFAPPTSCLATLTLSSSALFFGHNAYSYIDESCYPLGTLSLQNLVLSTSWDVYYYSPGLCPSGWTTATLMTSLYPGYTATISLGPGTTAAVCCPHGYGYPASGLGHRCASSVTQNQALEYVYPTNIGANGWNRGNVSTTTFAATTSVWGDAVPIWWQSSDLAMLASASMVTPPATSAPTSTAQPLPTASVLSSTGTSSPSSTGTSPPSSTSTGQPGSLSTGAKVGIGICVSVAVIAIFMGIFIFIRQRRNREGNHNTIHETDIGMTEGLHDYKPEQLTERPTQEIFTQPEVYHSLPELPSSNHK